MPNQKYSSGANFERKVIHDLVGLGAMLVMRGAGSKSYGKIKADIIALFPSGLLLIAQAKHSNRASKKEHEAFMQNPNIKRKILWWWITPENYKRDIENIKDLVKTYKREIL